MKVGSIYNHFLVFERNVGWRPFVMFIGAFTAALVGFIATEAYVSSEVKWYIHIPILVTGLFAYIGWGIEVPRHLRLFGELARCYDRMTSRKVQVTYDLRNGHMVSLNGGVDVITPETMKPTPVFDDRLFSFAALCWFGYQKRLVQMDRVIREYNEYLDLVDSELGVQCDALYHIETAADHMRRLRIGCMHLIALNAPVERYLAFCGALERDFLERVRLFRTATTYVANETIVRYAKDYQAHVRNFSTVELSNLARSIQPSDVNGSWIRAIAHQCMAEQDFEKAAHWYEIYIAVFVTPSSDSEESMQIMKRLLEMLGQVLLRETATVWEQFFSPKTHELAATA